MTKKTKHKTAESKRRRITINSITRLEGRGKIEILLSEKGCFERFAYERPTEDMAKIASRSCGMCPTAHHMAATKVLDGLYQVDPQLVAKKIRQLVYSTYMVEDRALHSTCWVGPTPS